MQKIKNIIKKFLAFLYRNAWIECLIIGLIINFAVEAIHRHSFFEGLEHVFTNPLVYLFNSLIISSVLSITTFFKRKYFGYITISTVWLGFGIANGYLLSCRVTPLEWVDLQIVSPGIIKKYVSGFEAVIILGAIILALALIVFMFIKLPKIKVNFVKSGISCAVFFVVLTGTLFSFRSFGILMSSHVKNIANAYLDYGFNYCFLCSALDTGVDKPEEYKKSDIDSIVDEIEKAAAANQNIKSTADTLQNGEKSPNIIFLQLETFFDVNHLSNVKFSENPIPNFSKLHKEFSGGYLTVPSIGAGTANTEFEIISGMSLEHFGVGEYPYKTILQTDTSESVCYVLKDLGYASHAIHNNSAIFYDRDIVFANLGFDTFTSVEYMTDVEYTSNGWAKDMVLVDSITDALDSSDASDIVYAITVQSHGEYPTNYEDKLPITSTGFSDSINEKSFNYYINQLYEVDSFIGALIEELSARDERTVVVMYGDHLPSFDISSDDLSNGNLFQTEFLIWDNFGLKKQDLDLSTYQLSSHILELLGYDNGLLTKLHQNFKDDDNYMEYLRTLEYDMLYGDKYAYGGEDGYPYEQTALKMGINDINIFDVTTSDNGYIIVKGEHFTEFSKIFINGKKINTVIKDSSTLCTANPTELSVGDRILVSQVDENSIELSSTKTYLIGGTEESPAISPESERVIYKKRGFKDTTSVAIIFICIAIISVAVMVTVIVLKRKKNKE